MADDNLHEDGETVVARWVPATVVFLALVGFIALAWYAYHAGKQPVKEDDLLLVEAEKTPMKEKPLDPGGMKFPNQDKTVFETFSPAGQQNAKVERVLPAPEEPLQKPVAVETKSFVSDKFKKTDIAPTVAPAPEVEKKPIAAAEMPVAVEPQKTTEKPLPVPFSPPSTQKVVTVPVESAPVEKPVAENSPSEKPAIVSGSKVQLGAYKGEEEAKKEWSKIQKKFAIATAKSPLIVKADLGTRGIYYRLRVAGFYSAKDAKKFCAPLVEAKQPCIVVAE